MKPYLFLHIPRTAGTSIASVLPEGRSTNIEINKLISEGTKSKNGNSLQHATLDNYPVCTDNLFKFTFVRNPWDRFVSVFQHNLKNCGASWTMFDYNTNEEIELTPQQQFDAFVLQAKLMWDDNNFKIWLDGHAKPQIFYTHDNEKSQIIDYVGYYERLEEDLKNLNDICEWNLKSINIPHFNKNSEKHYRSYYNQGNGVAKEVVYHLYRDEIELFGYEF